jgi:hypothetical protein
MKFNKDEMRFIYALIESQKYDFSNGDNDIFKVAEILEKKLYSNSHDMRRVGRTSQNSFNDLVKRLINK